MKATPRTSNFDFFKTGNRERGCVFAQGRGSLLNFLPLPPRLSVTCRIPGVRFSIINFRRVRPLLGVPKSGRAANRKQSATKLHRAYRSCKNISLLPRPGGADLANWLRQIAAVCMGIAVTLDAFGVPAGHSKPPRPPANPSRLPGPFRARNPTYQMQLTLQWLGRANPCNPWYVSVFY